MKNRIIFITGASSGIGKACAVKFAESGARRIFAARSGGRLQELGAESKVRNITIAFHSQSM